MICQKVIIINEGKIVAMDSLDSLTSDMGRARIILRVKGQQENILSRLNNIPGVLDVQGRGSFFFIEYESGKEDVVCEGISTIASKEGFVIQELRPEKISLEDIFVRIVTKDSQYEKGVDNSMERA